MHKIFILSILLVLTEISAVAQVSINTDGAAPDASAILDIKSTNKGLLPPRMTFAQRNAIVNPAPGLVVVCTNCKADGTECLSLFRGGKWENLIGHCTLPVPPVGALHLHETTWIIWTWNPAPIATGYKWNTTDNYATAIDVGTSTHKIESGLTAGTSYTRYVWAYNACGNSPSVMFTEQTLVNCGSSFTKTHTAGTVAPVTKTVTYGTVTNIPGEVSKCWITRNLGASQQPTAVDDNTEASAGWYWRFNRLQGYKHDGTTLTPAWASFSSESTDWESVNDPCTILLGNPWRIPTYTEWLNVDANGNWINWLGPWNSGLKIHAEGYLNHFENGVVTNRGAAGYYWSSTQLTSVNAWALYFDIGNSNMEHSFKPFGYSTRCIRN